MHELTILYYTARRIPVVFAEAVQDDLVVSVQGLPVVMVVQQATSTNIATNAVRAAAASVNVRMPLVALLTREAPPSIYQVYRTILCGARAAQTAFVAMAEDDTLYASSHWSSQWAAVGAFRYDMNRWVITKHRDGSVVFYRRRRHQMAMCVAPRDLLIETLEERFRKWPEPISDTEAKQSGWGEPGRYERVMRLSPRVLEEFEAPEPSVTFNHRHGLMGIRRINPTDDIRLELPVWGRADELWNRIYEGKG